MTDLKISDILEEVAAQYESGQCFGFSCVRIKDYLDKHKQVLIRYEIMRQIEEGLTEMGLRRGTTTAFRDVKDRNLARSIWLTWAAMMAREQGL